MSEESTTVSPANASPAAAPSLTVQKFTTPDYREPDPFEGPKLKIERAKRHIADFREAFKTLANSNIMRIDPEIDKETGATRIYARLTQPLPSDLRLTAADALYNLRSALDQAVCSCARLANESPDSTYFPHGSNKSRFEDSLRKKCKKIPEPIRAAIAALEPYHGGNGYLLQVLHDLNIVDKHRDLIAVFPMLQRVSISAPAKGSLPTGPVWRRTENKFGLTTPGDVHVDHNIKITMAVTFTDVEAIEGKSVTQVLFELCDSVERTIAIIEKRMSEVSTGLPAPG